MRPTMRAISSPWIRCRSGGIERGKRISPKPTPLPSRERIAKACPEGASAAWRGGGGALLRPPLKLRLGRCATKPSYPLPQGERSALHAQKSPAAHPRSRAFLLLGNQIRTCSRPFRRSSAVRRSADRCPSSSAGCSGPDRTCWSGCCPRRGQNSDWSDRSR